MILKVETNGLILKDSHPIDIGNFMILTGENGSGKSQLLQQISGIYGSEDTILKEGEKSISDVILAEPLNVFQESKDHTFISQLAEDWKVLGKIVKYYRLLDNKVFSTEFEELSALNEAIKDIANESTVNINLSQSNYSKIEYHQLYQITKLSQQVDKPISKLIFEDYIIFASANTELFNPSLAILFHQFHYRKLRYSWMVGSEQLPPWEVFNSILNRTNFKYRCEYKASDDPTIISPVALVDRDSGNQVHLNSLSSGEKTVMSLIFALYHSSEARGFPSVILFDEPDAYLHPALSKMFLDVIRDVFVVENNVKVILTTHSPSTVALAPEGSTLFVMNRKKGYPEPVSKKVAIRALMTGLTNINIIYENVKQVFVEADFDKEFYETMYGILQPELILEIYLTFISVGQEDGGCDRVKRYTRELSSKGSKYVCGIVDYDLKNTEANNVVVLGRQSRYNIESYVLDPLYLSIYLMRERKIDQVSIGYDKTDLYSEITTFSNEKIQALINSIIAFIEKKMAGNINFMNGDLVTTRLINGFELLVPKWYVLHPGHELEDFLPQVFGSLYPICKSGKQALKKDILYKVILDFPMFANTDFIETFKDLQNIEV